MHALACSLGQFGGGHCVRDAFSSFEYVRMENRRKSYFIAGRVIQRDTFTHNVSLPDSGVTHQDHVLANSDGNPQA